MNAADSGSGLLLGVDAGNSKTHVALVRASGEVLAVGEGRGASPHKLGVEGSWQVIQTLTARVLDESTLGTVPEADAAAYAVAGIDFDFEQRAFEPIVATGPARKTVVWNDTFAVMRAGTDGADGIAVVAGAGINCVGRWGEKSVRYPSLGRISGDRGGGIALGYEALALACRAEDGRGPDTRLRHDVPAYFGLDHPSDLTLALHRGEVAADRVVELARLVLRGADAGDAECARLTRCQADEVVAFIRATAARLGVALDVIPVLLGGGLLRAGCRVLDERIAAGLRQLHPGLVAQLAPGPPVVGAVQLAADLIGVELPASPVLSAAIQSHLHNGAEAALHRYGSRPEA